MKLDEPLDDVEAFYDDDADDDIRFDPPEGEISWPPVADWDREHWSTWLLQHDGWDQQSVDQYLDIDRFTYGLGLRRDEREPFSYFYLPVPAAIPFHAAKEPNLCYGGAVGGTKSHATRFDAYRHCLFIPGYQSLLMRRTHEELKRNHTQKAIGDCQAINNFYGNVVMDLAPTAHELRFPFHGNSLVTFGHCQNLGDEERYLGPEYDDFRPDEMATFIKEQIVGVATRLRSTKRTADWKILARLIGTTNPGGADAQWIKRWFIDRNVTPEENRKYRPDAYRFVGARLFDNPYLMDPDGTYTEYIERLYSHSRQRRRQLLNGDWNAITGQFFEEWDQHRHIGVLGIPHGCKIERWIDWGYDPNPGVCHWVACLPNGRLYVFAEWVFNGTGRPKRVAGKVAQAIDELTARILKSLPGSRVAKSVGDPSMFAKDGHVGESYAETFRRNRVRLVAGDNDRALGWGRLRAWFGRHPEGGAWLMYHPDCTYATRTIPGLIHDTNNPDDVDTTGEDHAGDADRYGVMGRPTPGIYRHTPTPSLPDSLKAIVGFGAQSNVRPFGKVM